MGRCERRASLPTNSPLPQLWGCELYMHAELPILRWGQPYTSLEHDKVIHFLTGETLAKVSQANAGLLRRDMRQGAARPRCATQNPNAGTDRAS